jgi:DNA repair protein RecN (Recombination protein N)
VIASFSHATAMLRFLQIRDFAIVDTLELEFGSGFTCISGETGAGKSILVGALGLLCGARADSAAVRDGAERAELTAEFELPDPGPALDWLRATELDDGADCLLRRTISAGGRSRAWINGTAVTLGQLAELGEHLVEIHGQNEHLRLVRSAEQFRLLDGGGDYADELQRTREGFFRWQALEQEKQDLLRATPLDAAEADLVRYQVEELEENLLTAADFDTLEKEHRMLARGGDVVAALEQALDLLQSDDGGGAVLSRAAALLDRHGDLDQDIGAAAGMLREAVINCEESAASIGAALARMDLSPERLAELEARIGRQYDLARKHRVRPDELEGVLQRLGERLERSGEIEKRLARIDGELETALLAYRDAASELHRRRAERAAVLSGEVTALMQELGMAGGRFELAARHETAPAPSARGDTRLAVNVSANKGTAPGPLSKVASGGELSRISLAVKIVASAHAPAATQVFDEVDAGVGGRTASAVGALLRKLAGGGQALCVTHLAQVAVFADRQLRVEKTEDEARTTVRTEPLDENGRVDEVARMLGGQVSERSRAHAAELLREAAQTRH